MELLVDLSLTTQEVTEHLLHLQQLEIELMLTQAREDQALELALLDQAAADHLQLDQQQEVQDLMRQALDLIDQQEVTIQVALQDHQVEV